ncbi:MAG: TRAP transporter small permease subunit, partial [Acidobacteria bacterium]|nr:TRAP transporter small permease subunit [Acidobacteriota bacterium]
MSATATALEIKDRAEYSVSIGILALMSALPIAEILGREFFGRGVPGSIAMVQHLTLWITFLGAALAARSGRLLTMATPALLPERIRPWAHILTSGLAAGIVVSLLLASVEIIRVDRESGATVAWGIPVWIAVAIMPVGFLLIAARLIWNAAPAWRGRGIAALGLSLPALIGLTPALTDWKLLLIALGSFLGSVLTPVNEALILLMAGAVGILLYGPPFQRLRKGLAAFLALPLSLAAGPALPTPASLALVFLKAGSLLFGTGFVIIPLLAPDVVETYRWMTQKEFFDGVTLG